MGDQKSKAGKAPAHEEPELDHYPPPPPGPPPGHNGIQEGHFPPPPAGPPPGHNGLAMHPNETPLPDSGARPYNPSQQAFPPPPPSEELYDTSSVHQTVHQPPPPEPAHAEAAAATGKKPGWGERLASLGSKAATPFNMLANKLGSEAFLPSTMDKECEKAARILRAFCKDGIYTDVNTAPAEPETETGPDGKPKPKPRKNRTLLTIPSKVINRAVGLAIFTTARAGFHVSGATGSGILIARLPDGSWSPPSGIQVHSVGAGFMIGIDIYDCVVVINTKEALEAFTKTRMSLGSDLAVVAGPWGAGGSVDFAAPASDKEKKGKGMEKATAEDEAAASGARTPTERHSADDKAAVPGISEPGQQAGDEKQAGRPQAGKERKPSALKQVMKQPTYSYVKSRGFYAGVQVDGTVVTERKDANAAFYGERISVQQILRGEVPLVPGAASWPQVVRPLFDVVKGAEGWRAQGQAQQGEWQNQNPTAVIPDPVAGQHPPSHPGPSAGASGVAAATQGVHAMNLDGAGPSSGAPPAAPPAPGNAKAAEAEAQRRARPVSAAPPYTEMAAADEQPPAYVDDGQPHPGVGDSKGAQPSQH